MRRQHVPSLSPPAAAVVVANAAPTASEAKTGTPSLAPPTPGMDPSWIAELDLSLVPELDLSLVPELALGSDFGLASAGAPDLAPPTPGMDPASFADSCPAPAETPGLAPPTPDTDRPPIVPSFLDDSWGLLEDNLRWIDELVGSQTPVQPTPERPMPVQPTTVQPTPVQPMPVQPTPVQPTPAQPPHAQPPTCAPRAEKEIPGWNLEWERALFAE